MEGPPASTAAHHVSEGSCPGTSRAQELAGEPALAVAVYVRALALVARPLVPDEAGCDPGPRLRAVFRRLLAATSEQDDRLRDLVAAVVRLHHVLDTSTPPHRPEPEPGERGEGGDGGGQRSAAAQPGALQEDCSRLMALIRAAEARARALAAHPASVTVASATG